MSYLHLVFICVELYTLSARTVLVKIYFLFGPSAFPYLHVAPAVMHCGVSTMNLVYLLFQIF